MSARRARSTAGDGRVAGYFMVRYATPFLVLVALAAGSARPPAAAVTAVLTAQLLAVLATHIAGLRGGPLLARAVSIGMVLDACAIAALLAMTDGPGGPLTFLFPLHALAAGILLSSRAGVRMLLMGTAVYLGLDMARVVADDAVPAALGATARLWMLGGGGTLFSAYNERELRRRSTELATIREVTLAIEDSLSLTDVCNTLCRGVVDGFDFDAAAVLVRDGGDLRCIGAHGVTGRLDTTIPLRGRVAAALSSGAPAVVPTDEARRDAAFVDLIGPRGFVAVPIDDVLLIATRAPRRRRAARVFAHEVEALERLGHHARLAIGNARLHERVSAMARTDALTGLANRGEFQRQLEAELGKLQRYAAFRAPGVFPSVILIDIDHFKSVNDRHGHHVGDAALRAVAAALRESTRAFDVVGRYGGEEFALVLPGTDAESARTVAERIRRAVAQTVVRAETGKRIRLTVSAGIATAEPSATPEALLKAADAALYRAKEEGRNRTRHALDGSPGDAKVLPLEPTRPRRGAAATRARGGSPRARARSSHPKPRTPRA